MRTFCITMPESPARETKAKAHFKERGLDNVHFFMGINAAVAGLATSHVYEVDNPGSGYKMGVKPTGCWLSHYMLWNALAHWPITEDTHFFIIEDDAKLDEDWQARFDKALKDAPPDFDYLLIGSCCTEGWPKEHVAGELWKVERPQCTHAYVVAKKALPFMLRTLRKCWAPVDIQLMFECFPSMKVYTLLPRAADQFDCVIAP